MANRDNSTVAGNRVMKATLYTTRRQCLNADVHSGSMLFLGNRESPINALDNCQFFRQDSSFLYSGGIDLPNLAAAIDVDADKETVFGDDPSLDDLIWSGPQPSLSARCRRIGVDRSVPFGKLHAIIGAAINRASAGSIFTPHRLDQTIQLAELCGMDRHAVAGHSSDRLVRSVLRLRSVRNDEELLQIEAALAINCDM